MAIRVRLARAAAAAQARAVLADGPAAISPAEPVAHALPDAPPRPDAPPPGAGQPAGPPEATVSEAPVTDAARDTATAAADEGAPVGALVAGVPIATKAGEGDRTLLYAVLIVLLFHVGALISAIRLGDALPDRRERQGQVDSPSSIEVELVEAPDEKSQIKRAQIGEVIPPAPPPTLPLTEPAPPPQPEQKPQEPQQAQQAQQAQPAKPASEAPPKDAPPKEAPPKKETVARPPDPADAPEPEVEYALDANTAAVKETANPNAEAREAKQAREAADPTQPRPPPVVTSQVLGAAPKGKQSAYSKVVINTLAKTKPQLWINRAETRIAFVVSPTGEPVMIRIVQSSQDKEFDGIVLEWIKRARFAPPPLDAKPTDLVYSIRYAVK